MKRIEKRLVGLGAVIAGLALLGAATASAANLQVRGVQSPPLSSGPCFDPDAVASYTMAGGLIGCWYTDTLTTRGTGQPSGTIRATGTEHFVGCLDLDRDRACGAGDPSGTLGFSFKFSGKFGPVTGAELHGRCQHPIISGSGDFEGASGVITFKDDVTNGTSVYRGQVKLN